MSDMGSATRDGRYVCPTCDADIDSLDVQAVELLPDNYFGWREVEAGAIAARPCGHRVRAVGGRWVSDGDGA